MLFNVCVCVPLSGCYAKSDENVIKDGMDKEHASQAMTQYSKVRAKNLNVVKRP